MKITINAPSYRRSAGVDTLKYLPFCKVWVCESEAEAYRQANSGAEIVAVPLGVQGNLCRIRNYILEKEFNSGVDAVALVDDDLQYFGYFEKKKRERLKTEDIEGWLLRYSQMAEEIGARIWGVNCNQDKQSYREYTPFSLLSYIGGPFSVHLKNELRYDESLPLKEDYDMTLQHLNKFRRVFRLNKFFYVVKQAGSGSGQVGGCAVYRNLDAEKKQLRLLQKKWGRKIVKYDFNPRSHNTTKNRSFDINPVIQVPIKGV